MNINYYNKIYLIFKHLIFFRKLNARRCRAVFLILASWIIPACLVLAATVEWNCDYKCEFLPHGFDMELNCFDNSSCSRIWQPLHNDFLSLHAVLWIIEVRYKENLQIIINCATQR